MSKHCLCNILSNWPQGAFIYFSHNLNPYKLNLSWTAQLRGAAPASVALTGEVLQPVVEVAGRWETDSNVLPACLKDAEGGGVQVKVVRHVVVLPDAASISLTQQLTAEHGSRRHIGNVRTEGGGQVLGQ